MGASVVVSTIKQVHTHQILQKNIHYVSATIMVSSITNIRSLKCYLHLSYRNMWNEVPEEPKNVELTQLSTR